MSKHKLKDVATLLTRIQCAESAKALPELWNQSIEKDSTPLEFLQHLLENEIQQRERKNKERKLKLASFPYYRELCDFDLTEQPSLNKKDFQKLIELTWVDQNYNLVLLGPTGTGKTFLSIGLGIKAVQEGYNVVFVTAGEIVHLLKTMEFTNRSLAKIKRIKKCDLLIIDDLMFMAMDKTEANLFFHLINEIYERTSIILTSNKNPTDWGQLIGDEIITGAILDRIVQHAEIIQLSGDSYRLRHREGIFNKKTLRKASGSI